MRYFYSHIVETSSLSLAIGDLPMDQKERKHLLDLIESNINHAILNLVLSELSEEDKITFVKSLKNDDHKSGMEFLKQRIENIEDRIYNTAEEIKKEFHKDIENAKKED